MAQPSGKAPGPGGPAAPRRARLKPPRPRQTQKAPKKPKEPKLNPNPADPLDVLKFELAEEMGLLEKVRREGWGGLSAAETGRLGGMMTRRRIEQGELVPGRPAPPRKPPASQAIARAEAGGDAEPGVEPEEARRSASNKRAQRGTV